MACNSECLKNYLTQIPDCKINHLNTLNLQVTNMRGIQWTRIYKIKDLLQQTDSGIKDYRGFYRLKRSMPY